MNFYMMLVLDTIKLADSDILAGVRYHTANSKLYFYDTSYNHTKQLGSIPVDLNGRSVVAEEVGNMHCGSMHVSTEMEMHKRMSAAHN